MSKMSKQVGSNVGMNITALIKKYENMLEYIDPNCEHCRARKTAITGFLRDLKELSKVNASWGKVKSSDINCGGNR
jgi:hypothetical protein